MIRTTATADTSPIDNLIDFLGNQDEFVAAIGQRVFDRHAPDLLSELQREPGKPKYPLQWTSEKQRKFVMAMLRKEDNLPYERTHKLSQGWIVKPNISGGVFSILVENPAPQAKFVYGSLAKNVDAAARFQQRFHQDTGWRKVSPMVTLFVKAMLEDFREEWKKEVTVKRRAYTKGSRK